jgi:carbonic anhydrase
VPIEIVFDQGVGDVFSTRVAGSVINEDVLGSLEYSCKAAGSKLVVVLGHSKCGAVTSACKGVKLGNITALLNKIKPAIDEIKSTSDADIDDEFVDLVIHENTKQSISRIRKESPILAEMETNGEIEIVGAYYDVSTGLVEFYS